MPKPTTNVKRRRAVRLQRILLAVDGSSESDDAERYAAELARLSGGEIRVFHMRPHVHTHRVMFSLEEKKQAEAVVATAVKRLKSSGATATGELVSANAANTARTIERAAEEFDADLIIVGARGLSTLMAMLEGSVTYDLIHHRRRPVLAVP
jgi:nucleotide-binding universal stress UspA family protein